jgi:hypothetical protein
MPRMSQKRKLEWSFFLTEHNRIACNSRCRQCARPCKQSFRAIIVACQKYIPKRGGL